MENSHFGWTDLGGAGHHDRRAAVTGAGDVNHVEVVFFDDPVQMHVNEVLARGCAPVSQQHMLHIREHQRPFQQRIVVKINLADRQVVGGAPVGVHLVEQFRCECVCFHGLTFFRCDLRYGLRPGTFGRRLLLRSL